jgi:MoxR-like ATPase/uncharacterized protein YktB (UPF0637 family)
MPFNLSEKDFRACKRSKTKNYIAPVRKKFDEQLKPQLITILGEHFKDFVTTGKHPSPYVARVYSRYEGGHYRSNMWLGMAHQKYDDPRLGVQLQFGISNSSVFSFGVWFEDNALPVRKEASQKILERKGKFLELLKALDDDYSIYASNSEERTSKANKTEEKDLDSWASLLAGDNIYFQIFRVLSKEAAIQMGDKIVEKIASTFAELLPIYCFLAGIETSLPETETVVTGDRKEEPNHAFADFKADPRLKSWKEMRLDAYKKFRGMFATENLNKLTKESFGEFLDSKSNKSWSGLQRHKPKIVANIERLRKTLAYLQDDEIAVDQRLFEILVKKDGEFRINGMGHNLATAILMVCDKEDQYGVWNERSEKTLRRFELIPRTLPSNPDEAYTVINKALNDLKTVYGVDLIEIDLFVWWVDELYGKALLLSVDIEKSPDAIDIHREQIRERGASYWGVGFSFGKNELGFPAELPLPLNGYLYEKGSKVNYCVRIESIESYGKGQPPQETSLRPKKYASQLWKTYIKISRLEALSHPIMVSEFLEWEDHNPVKQPPQGYVVVVDPFLMPAKKSGPSSALEDLSRSLELDPAEIQFKGLIFEDEERLKAQIHSALISGKNIMLLGPPGTGKTEIARSLGEKAKEKKYIKDYILTTATSDWTTFDTIGGYFPSKDGKSLEFRPGQFLRCFKEGNLPSNKWLIIDEINRADIDKAFGQLFTVLSGQVVQLPFVKALLDVDKSIEIMPFKMFEEKDQAEIDENEYVIPKSWRLIATLNTYDKASLYQMSYAFMRRFAFIYVAVPSSDFIDQNWTQYLDKWKIDPSGLESCFQDAKEIWKAMNKNGSKRPFGPAIIMDLLQFIVGCKQSLGNAKISNEKQKEMLTDAVASFILPQFEGLEETDLRVFNQELKTHCTERIDYLFKEMVGE